MKGSEATYTHVLCCLITDVVRDSEAIWKAEYLPRCVIINDKLVWESTNSNQVNWLADGPFYTVHCTSCSVAECASILLRSVNYEIPAVKRQIAKAQQLQKVPVAHQLYWSCLSADEGVGCCVTRSKFTCTSSCSGSPSYIISTCNCHCSQSCYYCLEKRFAPQEALNTLQQHSLVRTWYWLVLYPTIRINQCGWNIYVVLCS